MHLPRPLISQPYTTLLRTLTPSSPPILVLTALTVDALCGVRILTALLKRDFIPHQVQPVAGYSDLQRVGEEQITSLLRSNGGEGGVVVCVGCGGGVDLAEMLGLGEGEGIEVWVVDSRRGWNLENVFASHSGSGVVEGKVVEGYRSGKGGVVVWDEGNIETELGAEKEAWFALQNMPQITEDDLVEIERDEGSDDDGMEPPSSQTRKRKASSDTGSDADDSDEERPRQRRRSNTGTPIPSSQPTSAQPSSPAMQTIPSSPPKQPSQRHLRKQLLKLRRKHEATIEKYYDQGSWTGEPVSSIFYSLASELGREDNDLLWLAIVGVESAEMSPYTTTTTTSSSRTLTKLEQIKSVLRDEVRRLNPLPSASLLRSQNLGDDIPTSARSPTDTSIRLSPEPRFLLIRHWSLYESMLHATLLSTRLHVWNEQGRKRLNKLLAKMGISLQEAGKGYLHLDVEVKRSLRSKVLRFAEQYGLDGLVPADDGGAGWEGKRGWGFVRSWGWRGVMSAVDVAVVVGAILEVGTAGAGTASQTMHFGQIDHSGQEAGYNQRASKGYMPSPPHSSDSGADDAQKVSATEHDLPDWTTRRFFAAYDALSPSNTNPSHPNDTRHTTASGLPALLASIPLAQSLARAILRTGSALIAKNQIRHLRAFRLGIVKEGPDLSTFTHPGALVKLGGWIAEALAVLEAEKGTRRRAEDGAIVLASLDEGRGVYVVVGIGGGIGARGDGMVRSKQEIKERAERRAKRNVEKAEKREAKTAERVERRRLRRERAEANGLLDSDDEDEEAQASESEASSSSSAFSSSSNSDLDSDSDSDHASTTTPRTRRKKKGPPRNRFAQAFQTVVAETGARVRIDNFEHSVVEVRKEDLAGFLEGLSLRGVVG
ncbi:hypothetical protein LTR62_002716 [Meristemomyces frigidus]|uniref:CDC45-like protein n=1 Tax=Meristemomyces frigidus TaxID=1508187 RepID=A0AAN7YHB9_9PEZI|nr:hypothetical protein LTR62_002716 [Meristemomyces frigidus]